MLAKTRTRTTELPEIDITPSSEHVARKRGKAKPEAAPPESESEPETSRDKFERLCVARMNRALTSIRLLGNLASANYRWDEPDVVAIQAALSRAVEAALAKFEKHKKGAAKQVFVLPKTEAL